MAHKNRQRPPRTALLKSEPEEPVARVPSVTWAGVLAALAAAGSAVYVTGRLTPSAKLTDIGVALSGTALVAFVGVILATVVSARLGAKTPAYAHTPSTDPAPARLGRGAVNVAILILVAVAAFLLLTSPEPASKTVDVPASPEESSYSRLKLEGDGVKIRTTGSDASDVPGRTVFEYARTVTGFHSAFCFLITESGARLVAEGASDSRGEIGLKFTGTIATMGSGGGRYDYILTAATNDDRSRLTMPRDKPAAWLTEEDIKALQQCGKPGLNPAKPAAIIEKALRRADIDNTAFALESFRRTH